MSPYLVYGFGINPLEIPKESIEKLAKIHDEFKDVYCWFYEEGAGSNDEGIYYIIHSNPFNQNRDAKNKPWAISLEDMLEFKNNKEKMIPAKLKQLGIEELERYVKFYSSCYEV